MKQVKKIVFSITALAIIFSSPISARDIPAGPIWSDQHAQEVCPNVCSRSFSSIPMVKMVWDGNWHTTQEGKMSVCSCKFTGGMSFR